MPSQSSLTTPCARQLSLAAAAAARLRLPACRKLIDPKVNLPKSQFTEKSTLTENVGRHRACFGPKIDGFDPQTHDINLIIAPSAPASFPWPPPPLRAAAFPSAESQFTQKSILRENVG